MMNLLSHIYPAMTDMIHEMAHRTGRADATLEFLSGGGEMGALLRAYDWATTALGPPERWPQGLRTAMRLMLNTGHPVYIFWGTDGLCFYNDAYRPSLGPERHPHSMGKPAREVWAEIWPLIGAQLDQVMSGGGATWDENRLIPMTRNGQLEDVYWTYSYSPIDDETAASGIGGVLTLCTETTEQVQLLRDLALSQQRLSDLNADLEREVVERSRERGLVWQLSIDLLSVIDMSSATFDTVNPAWTAAFGWGTEEIEGRPYSDFVHPDDAGSSSEAFEQVRAGSPALQFENRYRTKDGSWRWLSWVAVPEAGKLYSVTRDITDEKARTAELETAQELLRQAQKMEAVGQLTGGLAHDFNNLLTGMMGNLELLQHRVARGRLDDLDRFILAAQGAGRRAASLTQRLLAFSRRQTLDPRPTDLNRLIGGMEDMLRRTIGPANTLEVVGAGGLWVTNIDAGQLENALLNSCINARDAMPDGGRLTVETANRWLDEHAGRERDLPPGQYVTVCVTDTGTGMDRRTIDRAFEPFFTTKPIGQGTGLGLSMIYGFARQSGGQVRIYSEVGMGTTVCIYLPRYVGEADLDTAPPVASTVSTGSGTILIVDDEATIRHLVDEVLDEVGYSVIGAADGAAGNKVLQSDARIDLLITDVGLPNGMNGRQVADIARSLRPGLKVLFITGYAENAAIGNGHLDPGMELLTKPFSLGALLGKVSEMMMAA